MVIESCLAEIKEFREFRGCPQICFETARVYVPLVFAKESLRKLKDDFGIAADEDLVGRDCLINCETGPYRFFSEEGIKEIVPYTGYTERDFEKD